MKIYQKKWFVEIAALILNLLLALIVFLVSRSSDAISEDTEFLVIATVTSLTLLLIIIKRDMVQQVSRLERQFGRLVTLFDPLASSIKADIIPFWNGRWKASWLIYADGDFVPYVDDGLTINNVSPELGMIEGIGHSAYDKEDAYKLQGRMISNRIVLLTYETPFLPDKYPEGTAMLRMDKMGVIDGWWMSNTNDIGGRLVLEQIKDDEAFEYQLHHQLNS